MERLKPALPVIVGAAMSVVVFFVPEAKPFACGFTLAAGAALVP